MRPAIPAVMGRNLAVPCGNRRRSQGNDSNEQHPRVVEAQQANAGETPNRISAPSFGLRRAGPHAPCPITRAPAL